MRPLDVRWATRSAAALYAVGAVLLVPPAFFHGNASHRPGILALAGLSAVAAAGLVALDRLGRASESLAFAAELLAVGIVAALVAQTDGAQSLYPAYFLLPVLHAAVFQGRARALGVGLAALMAFLAPLVYERHHAGAFGKIALAGLLPAIAFAVVTQVAVGALRRDRRALEEREAEALRIAESDELTGIGNYRRFWRALQSEAARARRHDQPFSLIVLDLDGFKAINDHLGHQAGDETLRRVARALEGQLREEDVLCRQGGDEFGVIAVAAGEAETAELARRLVDAVATAGGHGLEESLAASAGWATFGSPERTAEGLLALADRALREAKGRRRPPQVWPPAPHARAAAPVPSPVPSPRHAESEPAPWPAGTGNGEPEARGGPWARTRSARAVERHRPSDPRLAALSDFSRALALADDEAAVVQIAVAHVAEALDASAVELWRRDPRSGRPQLVARGRHSRAPGDHAVPVTTDEVAEVIRTNHVAGNGDGRLLVPVSHEGNVDGVLAAAARPASDGGLERRRLALAMAAQVARALAAATLRASLKRADPAELARLADLAAADADATRVAELALATARVMGLPPAELETLRQAALLHRVGMLGVPAGLPLRPTSLSPDELLVVREHPIIAERLLRPIPRLGQVARTLRHAHERHDGSGYPDGLAGEDIPLTSRILHAAIAYTAMRAHRPWRPALGEARVREELRAAAGGQLDPAVVEALLRGLESGASVA
ncbi:MAG: hypothetical protein QOE65_1729 [Solirubrobacteraceae bacterium]|jgi:diguanylate cyclase (GGDEF)-like protein|nr:hypothetical protein [Solirubrobacteraceae bacterium]